MKVLPQENIRVKTEPIKYSKLQNFARLTLQLPSASVVVPLKKLDVELKDDKGSRYGTVPMLIAVRRTS